MKKTILITLTLLIAFQPGIASAMEGPAKGPKPSQDELNNSLFIAIEKGTPVMINDLVRQGADVNVRQPTGWLGLSTRPLYKAVLSQRPEAIEITRALIEAGADIHVKESDAVFIRTPLDKYIDEIKRRKTDSYGSLAYIPQEALKMNQSEEMMIKVLTTSVSPREIQHIIPGIIATRRKFGRDVGQIIASEWIPAIINEKFALAKQYLPTVPDAELRSAIEQSIKRVISKSPRIQATIQEVAAQEPAIQKDGP